MNHATLNPAEVTSQKVASSLFPRGAAPVSMPPRRSSGAPKNPRGSQPPRGVPAWQRAHEALERIAKQRAALDWEEGRWLLLARQSGAHARLGFASFAEYVERLLGHSPRRTEEKLRVAEALERLPGLATALQENRLCWSGVRELTRVASEPTEAAWIAAAEGRSVREIEELVSGHVPGDAPSDARDPKVERHVLRLELKAETLATFRQALAKLRRDASGPLDDDDAVLLMARQVLGGPIEAGTSSYQIELTVCERCKGGTQHGKGRALSVTHDIVKMAECDALRFRPPEESPSQGPPASVPKRAAQTIPPAVRRRVMRRHGGGCAVPGCRHAVFVDVHHVNPRAEGGTHDPDTLVVLCSAHHRALHRGRLLVEGSAPSGFVFRHADGSAYGNPTSPPTADVAARAFGALKQMGFKETEARRALADTATQVGGAGGFEDVLRAALTRLAGRALRVSDVAQPTWARSRTSCSGATRVSPHSHGPRRQAQPAF